MDHDNGRTEMAKTSLLSRILGRNSKKDIAPVQKRSTDNRTTHMTQKTLLEQLDWRYATKKMDPAKAVPQEKVEAIVEAIRMAPTSSGTQPFELLVVTNPEVRSEICKAV